MVRSSAEDLSSDELRRAMDSLLRVGYMGSLLESMLAEADAASAEVRLLRPVKVDDLARETVEDMSDSLRGRQALTALLVNASRYSPDGTPISVRVVGRPQVVELAVADHCGGIAGEARERIFERHSRLDHSGEGRGWACSWLAAWPGTRG